MANHYSPSEFFKTAYSLLLTKLTFPQCRLIRRPIYIRGAYSMDGAQGLTTGRFCRFDLDGNKKTLMIGPNCEFGDLTHIVALNHVEIGANVLIASKCFISDINHGNYKDKNMSNPSAPPKNRQLFSAKVVIGENVWIGENVVILPGTIIGDGCVIGANSVVKGVIPTRTIAVGAPARIVKVWNSLNNTWEKYRNKENKE